MPLSNSVIRRYTPPTCTLEVLAQSSPLSQWMGKTVLKQLSFELRFEDPQLPEEDRVPIRGDRDQLEALCDAVTSYVQEFLHQTPDNFWVSFSGPQDSSKVSDESALADLQQFPLPGNTKTLKSFNSQIPSTKIYLEPSNYLTHNLFLGSLANQTSVPVIRLSLLQLFDLATALDEYAADVMALPTLNRTSTIYPWPAWTSVAAVLALGVGLLPVTWQYVNQTKPKQQIATKSAPESTDIAIQPSPLLNFPTPQPGLTPSDNFPPLPGVGVAPPLPTSSLPAPALTAPNTGFSTASQKSPISRLPTTALPSPGNVITIPQGTNPTLSQNSKLVTPITGGGQQIAIQPNLKPNPTGSVSLAETPLPLKRSLPPSLSAPTANITPPLATSVAPSNSPLLDSQLNPASDASAIATDDNRLVSKLRNASKTAPPPEVATNSTLFDTPLVTEAREYFQKRWQPPAGLTQTLEYSLIVGVDGTIERILPLNKAARDYVDSAGIPNIGKPFVSANRSGKNLRIRAVLSPNGKVQVLPEN
ncbi:DUF4335 domain-containing protein [Calothrix sp. PCC 7507]|uniref:DUF4335 domain-containing protein n=1 Tax=Calothrix sp. PCC 7507 TaxID=99598 RepID=UPI00029F2EC2|nr:DUF4335 domain-containing protein [Calothrix sp. PCC 7507]AFY36369.1 hypothetical protein Cal7507_6065 [Calothrix sp. PCC 7507]